MTITEAMKAVNDEYNAECIRARQERAFGLLMSKCIGVEYDEIDKELPDYVSEIASSMGVPNGSRLAPWIYQLARMAFRMGMRTQRKLDHPDKPTTMFWRSDQGVS